MKIRTLILLFLLSMFVNCRKEDQSTDYQIDGYYYGYMDYPSGIFYGDEDPNVSLIYSGGRIVKRIGGVCQLPSPPFIGYGVSGDIYDELSYKGSTISIVKKTSKEGGTIDPDKRIIQLNNQGMMVRQIFVHELPRINDTVSYIYTSPGLLDRAVSNYGSSHGVPCDTSFFYYNQANNLDSIITRSYNFEKTFVTRKIEEFRDYDNAPNPLKSLFVFMETFHRSLSENNYQSYSMRTYNAEQELIAWADLKYGFTYDNNGIPVFRK